GGGTGGMVVACGATDPLPNSCPSTEPYSAPTTCGTATCGTCTTDQCSLGAAGTDGCCGLGNAADQVLCEAVVKCFTRNSSTCTVSGDGTNCFCGTSGGNCFMNAGAANGPCTAEVVAAAKTSTPAAIQGQFTSPASPLGRAVNIIACRGSFCSTECGIN
ncbi:MAG TPA: hypothetical protein VIM73_21985, partial [Polyangiaceae bacterium]